MRFRHLRNLVCATLLVALACGCSDAGGSLSGSLGDSYDLGFDHTRARLYSSEFAVEYVADDGQVPVRVSVVRDDTPLKPGTYDLKARGDITGQRGDNRIPRFISGTIEFDQISETDGAAVVGNFEAKFETGRDESTLSGDFDTTLEVIDGPHGYGFDTGPDAGPDAGSDTGSDTGDADDGGNG